MNPYESPKTVPSSTPSRVTQQAPMTWFAGTVAGLVALFSLWFAVFVLRFNDVPNVVVRTLAATAIYSVAAVSVYGVVRRLVRVRADYSSTRKSLVIAAGIVAAYIAVLHFVATFSATEFVVWLVGLAIAIPFCFAVCSFERMLAGESAGDVHLQSTDSREPPSEGVSLMWFSAACLIFGFAACLRPNPSIGTVLLGASANAAILCLVGTILYASLNACIKRPAPPTLASRIGAAAVFVLLAATSEFVMNAYAAPPGLYRLLICAVFAAVCVFVDRLVAGRTRQQKSVEQT